jgi:predicted nucleic acid-binding Zn ribbon protein
MTRHSRRRKEERQQAGALLARALGRKEIFERIEARRISQRWSEAVGAHLAERSQPDRFDHGVLTIAVASAPWAQELQLRKRELLGRLNETAGRDLFEDLRFVVRNLEKASTTEEVHETFAAEDPGVKLSAPEEIAVVIERALGRLKAASKRKR